MALSKGVLVGAVLIVLVLCYVVYYLMSSTTTTTPTTGGTTTGGTTTGGTTTPALVGWQNIAQDGSNFQLNASTNVLWGVDATRNTTVNLPAGVYTCGYGSQFTTDPAPGVPKVCSIDGGNAANLVFATTGPYAGTWVAVANADAVKTTVGAVDVRYGVDNRYLQKNINGQFTCNVATFGGDPAFGATKKCYVVDPTKVV